MKNIVLLMIMFPFVALSQINEKIKLVRESYGLKGNVKKMVHQPVNNEMNEDIFSNLSADMNFDEKGYITHLKVIDPDGIFSSETKIEYNHHHKIISSVTFAQGKLADKKTYEYDDKNREITENIYNENEKIIKKITNEYNDKDSIINKKKYNEEEIVYDEIIYQYNDNHQKIEEVHLGIDGVLRSTYKYEYSDKKMTIYIYDSNDNHTYTETYIYDENRNLLKKIRHNELSETDISTQYKYDEKGRKIEKLFHSILYDKNGLRTIYKYDKYDNIIMAEEYEGKKLTEKEVYERIYDEKGNWVEEKHIKNEKLISHNKRNIEYY